MIRFSRITRSEEMIALSDYYILSLPVTNSEENALASPSALALLRVEETEITQETAFLLGEQGNSDSDRNTWSPEQAVSGLLRLLPGTAVLAEAETLRELQKLLASCDSDGEIRYLPVTLLAAALYPELRGMNTDTMAESLQIAVAEEDELLRPLYVEKAIFEHCVEALGGDAPAKEEPASDEQADQKVEQEPKAGSRKRLVSSRKLNQISTSIWSVSPWFVVVLAAVIVLVVFLLLPRKDETKIDRETAPVNYIVLSWNETGKYGTQPKTRGGAEEAIQFRLPYGVYNVLNNNSIPVELNILSDDDKTGDVPGSGTDSAQAQELSSSDSEVPEDEEEGAARSRVVIRPNSSRQISIDTDQYLTLSEDATNLIFFYLSEIPEETESDSAGSYGSGQQVLYAYVKGTEVRFRKAPSLEGQVIDTLNNGQQVQVLAVTGEWTHVSVKDQKGYIFSQYLSSEDPDAAKAESEQTEESTAPADQTQQQSPPEQNQEPAPSAEQPDAANSQVNQTSEVSGPEESGNPVNAGSPEAEPAVETAPASPEEEAGGDTESDSSAPVIAPWDPVTQAGTYSPADEIEEG